MDSTITASWSPAGPSRNTNHSHEPITQHVHRRRPRQMNRHLLWLSPPRSRTFLESIHRGTLRLPATSYIFKEVAPNVFAHTRNSVLVDTGKTLDEIKARYERNAIVSSSGLKLPQAFRKVCEKQRALCSDWNRVRLGPHIGLEEFTH